MGFITQDGAELVGGLDSSSIGHALKVDALGGLLVSLASLGPLNNGQLFYGTTGQESEANATVDAPCSIFNPSNSTKNALFLSWIVSSGTGALIGYLYSVTTDPNYGSSLTVVNGNLGSAVTSVLNATFDNANHGAPSGGTQFRRLYNNYSQEMIPNGYGILLPKGSAHGVVAQMETYATGIGGQSQIWLEF